MCLSNPQHLMQLKFVIDRLSHYAIRAVKSMSLIT